jgi:hypothetical protein
MVVPKMVKNGNNPLFGIHNQSFFLIELQRAALPIDYVLKYVGETALSGLPRFSDASLFMARHSRL